MTGIADVAQVVFVRKRLVEIQYLRTTITEEQRQELGRLVEDTIRRIDSAGILASQWNPPPAKCLEHMPVLGTLSRAAGND